MEEKIKISLPKTVLTLLKIDCKDFNILKENGQPNFNAFINTLVVNYYQNFSANEEVLYQDLKKAIQYVPDYYKESLFEDMVKIFAKRVETNFDKKDTTTFSFKPTKNSLKAISYIQGVLTKSQSLSSFYRRMFISYSKISKNEREKIIHKENYEQILKAIKNEMQITVFLQNGKRVENLSVYAVASAKEEMFNYVLVCQKGHNITFRLNNIKLMYLQSAKAKITNANKILFDKQIECGVQYPFYNTDDKPIKVVFSEEGKHMFEKIYLYRPTPTEINGNEYTFNCSAKQMIHYLQRFGSEAVITAPKKLGIFMRNHYHFALKKYKEFYKKD